MQYLGLLWGLRMGRRCWSRRRPGLLLTWGPCTQVSRPHWQDTVVGNPGPESHQLLQETCQSPAPDPASGKRTDAQLPQKKRERSQEAAPRSAEAGMQHLFPGSETDSGSSKGSGYPHISTPTLPPKFKKLFLKSLTEFCSLTLTTM